MPPLSPFARQQRRRAAAVPGLLALLLVAGCASEPAPGPKRPAAPERRLESLQPPAPPAAAAPSKRIADSRFAAGQVGYVVRDLTSGRVVAQHNPDRRFIPASLTKIATGIAALETLGGDHRFVTRVASGARVADGQVRGDLALMGGSNPLLATRDLMTLCQRLRARGVTGIAGELIVDDSGGVRRRAINRRQPPDAAYNPALSPLSVNFNRVRLVHRLGASGESVTAYSVPPLPGIELALGQAGRTAADGPWTPKVRRRGVTWRLDPATAEPGSAWVPLKRPARAAGALFRRMCAGAGVTLPEPEAGNAPAEARTLAAHRSEPVAAIVAAMFEHSNNLVAELLGGATSQAMTGRTLSLPQSSATINQWWRQTLPEMRWRGFAPRNHSGLTAAGRATPAQVAAMLNYAAERTYATAAGEQRGIRGLLPVSGSAGALGGRLDAPGTALRVWGKTGTMHFASGLAGYMRTTSDRDLAFAVMITDRKARKRYDARRRGGGEVDPQRLAAWREAAKDLEADLVRAWLTAL